MSFNSYEFVFGFLPVTVAVFWLLVRFAGRTVAVGWLILSSIAFYAASGFKSLLVVISSVLLDYVIALILVRVDPSRRGMRKLVFFVGIATNLLLLGYFKYQAFFVDTVNTVFATQLEATQLLLPLGISFITFQKVAFLADVQSGQVKEFRFPDFILFNLFFPRAVAGPIVHYGEITPQIANITVSNIGTNAFVGICLFSIGLFKKTVIADGLAEFVPPTFETSLWAEQPTLLTAWIGVLSYTFQLYFDFSGYSDMALGVARMVGVRLPMNFNSPFKAGSIVEFWSRWHITLTRFLTTYIYTPITLRLSRARVRKGKSVLRGSSTPQAIATLVALPILITMLISGLWHGAGWQFIWWGLLHGFYLTINQSWRILRPRFWPDQASYARLMKPLGFLLTFTAVTTAMVFFRATSVTSALSILRGMFGMNGILPHQIQLLRQLGIGMPFSLLHYLLPFTPFIWIVALLLGVILLPNALELLRRFQPALDFDDQSKRVHRLEAVSAANSERPKQTQRYCLMEWLGAARASIIQFEREGIPINGVGAAFVALVFVLAVAGLTHSAAFVYAQF